MFQVFGSKSFKIDREPGGVHPDEGQGYTPKIFESRSAR